MSSNGWRRWDLKGWVIKTGSQTMTSSNDLLFLQPSVCMMCTLCVCVYVSKCAHEIENRKQNVSMCVDNLQRWPGVSPHVTPQPSWWRTDKLRGSMRERERREEGEGERVTPHNDQRHQTLHTQYSVTPVFAHRSFTFQWFLSDWG